MKEGEDDGGTLALQMSEDLSNKNWADIMQEEQYIAPPINDSPEREPSPLPGPPYFIQVNCIGATEEEIFFLFGGETTVKWMQIVEGKGKVELHDENAMRRVLELNGEAINDGNLAIEIVDVRASNDVRMGGMSGSARYLRHDETRRDDSYHNQKGAHRQDDEYHRGGYYRGHVMRADRGGHHHSGYGSRGGHMDGGYAKGRAGFRGRGDMHNRGGCRGAYGGEMSGRYHDVYGRGYHQYGHPRDQRDYQAAPINRSRTESTSSHVTMERAPSRFSCDAPLTSPQGSVDIPPRKPSNKSIFGDAKPVDTSKKLCEMEEKLVAEKERKERERKEKEIEEKKRLEDEKREKEEEKKRKEDEKKRIDEEREREKEKEKEKTIERVHNAPIHILRRAKTAESSDGQCCSIDREGGIEDKGEKGRKDEHRKRQSFKKDDRDKEKERERDGEREREKSLPKTMRTFSNSTRIMPKSGSVDQEETIKGEVRVDRGRGRGRGTRGRGRGGFSSGSGRKNSIGSTVDQSIDREKDDERREKKEELRDYKEKDEKMEKKPFNIQSRLYSDVGESSAPSSQSITPSIHSSLPPPSNTKSIHAKEVTNTSEITSDVLPKVDSDKNVKKRVKAEERLDVKEEKKSDAVKLSTPQKKKNKGKDKDKLKFASNNKFAALLED